MEDAEGSCIPRDYQFGTSSFVHTRNRFRVEPSSSSTSSPGAVVTFVLPEGSLIDTQSISIVFNVKTTQALTSSTVNAVGKVIDASSLFRGLQILCNGRQLVDIPQDMATISRILKITSSRDVQETLHRPLSHAYLDDSNAVDEVTVCLTDILGLKQSSMRYWPTSLLGSVQIRLTCSSAIEGLCIRSGSTGYVTTLASETERTQAKTLTYSLSQIRLHCDAVSCPAYTALIESRIQSNGFVSIFMKDYTITNSLITSSNASVRWSQSTSSLDRCYAVLRNPLYHTHNSIAYNMAATIATMGAATELVSAVSNASRTAIDSLMGENLIPLSYGFTLDRSAPALDDSLYSWEVNSVSYPQYTGTLSDALFDLSRCNSSSSLGGTMVTSRLEYNKVNGVIALLLSHNDVPNLRSGFNTRGVSSQIQLRLYNLNTATSSAPLECTVIAESTIEIRLGAGGALAVDS